jgi:hypothetical protein
VNEISLYCYKKSQPVVSLRESKRESKRARERERERQRAREKEDIMRHLFPAPRTERREGRDPSTQAGVGFETFPDPARL